MEVATRFYCDSGLSLNVRKCAALRLKRGVGLSDPVNEVDGMSVRTLTRGEVFKYLGAAVPVEGLDASARFGGQLADLLNPITSSKADSGRTNHSV